MGPQDRIDDRDGRREDAAGTEQGMDRAEESSMEAAVDEDLEDGDPENPDAGSLDSEDVQPGAEGPIWTGIEGADQAFEDERVAAEGDELEEFADFEDEDGEDDSAAAEQGNRDQDEMISEGDDPRELDELAGDATDVDDLGDPEGMDGEDADLGAGAVANLETDQEIDGEDFVPTDPAASTSDAMEDVSEEELEEDFGEDPEFDQTFEEE